MFFSAACERNKEALLAVLRDWLPPGAQVLEVGSGSGQHAVFFAQSIAGLTWQTSELTAHLAGLGERLRVARENAPFERAFAVAGIDDFGHRRERDDGLHAGETPDVALEPIHQRDDIVVDGAVGDGCNDDREDVDPDGKLFGDDAGVHGRS